MPKNALEHTSRHREEHRVEDETDQIAEWQQKALQPFVDDLSYRNKDLVQEIAKELEDVTKQGSEKHHVSWLDNHEEVAINPADLNYRERPPNQSETDMLLSYTKAAEHLDQDQTQHLSGTIMEAVAHRTARALTEHFPNTSDFSVHHQRPNIADPESYNQLMNAAKFYYAEASSQAENNFQESLKAGEAQSFTYAIDRLRTIEKDIEHTAETAHMPSYLEHIDRDQDFFKAYHNRADALYKVLSQDFQEKYPELTLDPETPEFLEHFREITEDYLHGDRHSLADYISDNRASERANALAHTFDSPYDLNDAYWTHREKIYDSLILQDT